MSLRLLAGALVFLGCVALWRVPAISGSQNPPNTYAYTGPKWEYKVRRLDDRQCLSENYFNREGKEGWELVNHSTTAIAFPQAAQGSLLIKPAATGPGAANNPPTADSFRGTMEIKIPPAEADACQVVFKRLAPLPPGQPR